MKLTKKIESEIKLVIDAWWENMLNANTKGLDEILDKDLKQIGTVEAEVFFNKKDAINFVKKTADQIIGKIELRNRTTKIEHIDELIIIIEFFDIYVKTERDWSFYSKARGSYLLQKKGECWKFIQQHISFPDSKAQEGETIALEKITKENIQLRDAVKRRTIELEQKNRELEIEAALERVRARTMAMQKSDELNEVVAVMYDQVKKLGFSDYACSIIICDKTSKILRYWYAEVNQLHSHLYYDVPLTSQPVVQKQWKSWRKGLSQFRIELKGKEKEDYTEFMLTETDHKNLPENVKAGWRAYPNVYFSYSNIKYGLLEFADIKPLNEDNISIYKSFAKVFKQTYTRFLDLQKAEAQAREAQIEVALERVRARAMAMRNSNELGELIENVFKELSHLNVQLTRCWIWIFDPDTMDARMWWAHMENVASEDSATGYFIPYNDRAFYRRQLKAWKSRKSKVVEVLGGDVKVKWDDFLFSKSEMSKIPNEIKDGMRAPDSVYLCSSFNNFGGLGTGGLEPLSDENQDIIYRFARVFDLTYTRFNDLLQAEEQAREAQIEVSLERVRSRTMAMHSSEELPEVVFEFFEQLHPLGFAKWGFQLRIAREDKNGFNTWISTPAERILPDQFHIPTLDHWVFRKYWKAYEKQLDQVTIEVSGNDKLRMDMLLFEKSDMKNFSAEVKKSILAYDYVQFSVASMRYGLLEAIDVEPIPKEQFEILQRFAKVFEQTYTRFLDLQKAEAQAREAQIEAALEKIRASSNGMHKSEELSEVALLLNRELKKLGFPEKFESGFIQMEEENNIQKGWMSDFDGNNMEPFSLPLKGDHILDERYDSWKNIRPLLHQTVGGEKLQKHINFCQPTLGSGQVWEIVLKNFSDPTHFYHSYFLQGAISVIAQTPLNKEQESLLERFTRVFEQTYTRFLDLKKAEAQAKEAQIETALERVRSRSMAMHNSKELREVIAVVFEQLTLLGFTPQGCDIVIYDKKELDASYWFAGFEKGNYPRSYVIPYNEHPYYQDQINAWRGGEKYKVFIYEGELKKKYDDFVFEETDFKNLPESAKRGMRSLKYAAIHDAFMSHGIIETIDLKPISEEFANILQRFAKVFDQTYTRFLDLQKAEAQAREAQIEAALERVRSKAMSMQKSEDLSIAVATIFDELDKLKLGMLRCGIGILNKEKRTAEVWTTTISEKGKTVQVSGDESMDIHPVLKGAFDAWLNQKDFSYILEGEDLNKYYKALLGVNFKLPASQSKVSKTKGLKQYYYVTSFQAGGLFAFSETPFSDESKIVMKRFADVFTLTYTRFHDLMQAEAQNKIIQAENERKTQELEEARQLQLAMLPKELPQLPNLDIAVHMQTATEVGGDYYDFRVEQDGTLNVALGDATGHGLKAGTLVTIMKGLFTAEAENNDVLPFFNKSSKAIKELKLGRLMMAFVFLKIKGRQLSLSNAGIPPVYIFRSEIEEVEEIDNKGMPLGAMKNFPYKETKIELNKGNVILLLSDGFPELFNEKKEMFGYDRVRETFAEVADRSSERIIEHLRNTVSEWVGDKDPDDDVTFVVLKMK